MPPARALRPAAAHPAPGAARGARWSSVPLGSPACVDGPFLEGGDTLLNGYEVYVGMSGCASDMAGIDWLQALLGDNYRVIPVAMRSNVLHLDCALALIKPGLLVWCPEKLIDGLPTSLRDWDAIAVSKRRGRQARDQRPDPRGRPHDRRCRQRARDRRAAQAQDGRDPLPFDGPIPPAAACAAPTIRCCAKAYWTRRPSWACGRRRSAWAAERLPEMHPQAARRPSPPGRRRSAAARRRSGPATSRRRRMKLWPARRNVVAQKITQAAVTTNTVSSDGISAGARRPARSREPRRPAAPAG